METYRLSGRGYRAAGTWRGARPGQTHSVLFNIFRLPEVTRGHRIRSSLSKPNAPDAARGTTTDTQARRERHL
eukprot:4450365-Prymnesium_polylepis.1